MTKAQKAQQRSPTKGAQRSSMPQATQFQWIKPNLERPIGTQVNVKSTGKSYPSTSKQNKKQR